MSSSHLTAKPVKGLVFILNVQITVKEKDADTWLAAFKETREAVLAEPESLFFNLGRKMNVDPITQGPGNVPEGEVAFSWSEALANRPSGYVMCK